MPIDVSSIEAIMKDLDRDPTPEVIGATIIAVNAASDPLQVSQRGLLKVVTPEEPRMALVLQLKKLIDAGAGIELLQTFRALILSAPCGFESIPKDEKSNGGLRC